MRTLLSLLFTALIVIAPASARAAGAAVRLYAIDCGTLKFDDMDMFADDGSYAGQPGEMAEPCYLIQHPKGTLLWDTGLGDAIHAAVDHTKREGGIAFVVPVTLQSQLQRIGIAPDKIDFVSLSHMHYDHTGNLKLFPKATWLVDPRELAWASAQPTPASAHAEHFTGYAARQVAMEGDHDVFGDGRVRILRAPGHTPGHRVLMLQLEHAGTVILSGDLYHSHRNYEHGRMPSFNVDRADTLASFDRVRHLLEVYHGRLVIQHAPEDFAALPAFPAYLD